VRTTSYDAAAAILSYFYFEGGLLHGYPEKLGGLGAYGGLGYGAHHEGLGYGEKFNGGYLGGYGGKLNGGYLGGYGGKLDGGHLGGYGYHEGSLGLAKHGGY